MEGGGGGEFRVPRRGVERKRVRTGGGLGREAQQGCEIGPRRNSLGFGRNGSVRGVWKNWGKGV